MREMLPEGRRIAALWDVETGDYQARALHAAAQNVSVELQVIEFRGAAGLESALVDGLKAQPNALIQLGSPMINQLADRVVSITAKHRVPAISMFRSFPEGGGLMSYGPVLPVWYRRLGRFVAVVINLKTAKTLSLTIPQSILLRADEVIE